VGKDWFKGIPGARIGLREGSGATIPVFLKKNLYLDRKHPSASPGETFVSLNYFFYERGLKERDRVNFGQTQTIPGTVSRLRSKQGPREKRGARVPSGPAGCEQEQRTRSKEYRQ
jgi:hypothetical protein